VEIGKQTVDIRVTSRIRLLVRKLEELKIPKMVMNPNIGCRQLLLFPLLILIFTQL
jgi:hypothetical protein